MEDNSWVKEIPVAVTVADCDGVILEMNDKAIKTFEKYGGKSLIGKNLCDCHQAQSNEIIKQIIETGEKHIYTIEKDGLKKMIYQSPWFKKGKCAGIIEISLEIPFSMPHFVRT